MAERILIDIGSSTVKVYNYFSESIKTFVTKKSTF